ncbi:hypothetical protein [Streptomyces sp. Tu 4128]|uniref:hypothetical protein n=1 Tax=Streptomyces sp. Tu 4128 TaxID=1120314 RepID=UPI0013CF091D|nr:hypothetical protein [Streptomyces sp. Tu 4128]
MDWKWTVTAVLPVISLVLGAWLTQLNDRRRDASQLEREVAAHTLERKRQREERQEGFELAHLADLHSSLADLVSFGIPLCFQRIDDPNAVLPEEWEERNRKVSTLRTLVLDDKTRADVAKLQMRLTQAVDRPMEPDSSRTNPAARGLMVHADQVFEQIAARIREIYKASA